MLRPLLLRGSLSQERERANCVLQPSKLGQSITINRQNTLLCMLPQLSLDYPDIIQHGEGASVRLHILQILLQANNTYKYGTS